MNQLHRDIKLKIEDPLFLISIFFMVFFAGPLITFMTLALFLLSIDPIILAVIINIMFNKNFLDQLLVCSLFMIVMFNPWLLMF